MYPKIAMNKARRHGDKRERIIIRSKIPQRMQTPPLTINNPMIKLTHTFQ